MASPAELSLDYKPNSTYTIIQKPQEEQPDPHTQKIQDFLARLEEELHKIEAFKRELPLCMQLLNNAIEIYKQQLEKYQTSQVPRSVLEEFMPLKHMNTDGSEKANWMVSAQLWSPPNNEAAKQQAAAAPPPPKEPEHGFDMTSKLALDTKQRNGGAFLPFSKEKNKAVRIAPRALPELALTSSEKAIEEKKCAELENGGANARGENGTASDRGAEHGKGGSSNTTEGQAAAAAAPTNRKARRCWSPDLHRRFVNALQILGGSQVATPKQIRELMKVDGLTNDEVKSHLQKYRLHTRRPAPVPHAAAVGAAPRLVVLGGIWVPPEYATSAAAGPAIYGAHAASAHYCTAATPVPQEFYPPPLPPVPHHHHHHLHSPLDLAPAAAAYKGRAAGSPESEVRSGGERSESIEEEEEGEERVEEEEEAEEKALVPLQAAKAEDGNGGDVALKF